MYHTLRDINIYISRVQRVYGPYRLVQIIDFLKDGQVSQSDWSWIKGRGQEWVRLDGILDELQQEIEKLRKSKIFAEKIVGLLEKENFDFAFDLVTGSNDPDFYETMLDGSSHEDGEIDFPDWVGWEERNKTFFFQILEKAPATDFIDQLRAGTEIIDHSIYDEPGTKFPAELLQFFNLRVLHLTGDKLDSMPPEIKRLGKLEELSLENLEIRKLPDSLRELPCLQKLSLVGNSFSEKDSNLEILGELKNLKHLDCSHCKLKSFDWGWIRDLPHLETLSLEGNNLSGIYTNQLLSTLSLIPSLKELSLANCDLPDLPEVEGGFTNLVRLDLSGNDLADLPVFLSNLPQLKWINLQGNPVFSDTDEHRDEAPDQEDAEIDHTVVLSSVSGRESYWNEDCSNTEYKLREPLLLSSSSQKELSEFEKWAREWGEAEFDQKQTDQKIDQLISLGDADLLAEIARGCFLEKEGTLVTGIHFPFPYWVPELFAATSLHHDCYTEWSETGWGGDVKCTAAEKFHYFLLRLIPYLPQDESIHSCLMLDNIIALDLCLPGVVPPEIGLYSNLRELSLTKNNLQTLPREMGALSKLEILQLDRNEILEFPAILAGLKNLKFLSITGNSLSQIGPDIQGLTSLEVLDCSSNKIQKLPKEIASLSQMKFLGLKDNKLQALPSEISALERLEQLWVGSNPIETLPPEIYRMKDLRVMGLCESSCFPEDSAWVLEREVFLSGNSKSMMLIREKDQGLLDRLRNEISPWN